VQKIKKGDIMDPNFNKSKMTPTTNKSFVGLVYKDDIDDFDQIQHIWIYGDHYQLELFKKIQENCLDSHTKFKRTTEILVATEVEFKNFIQTDFILDEVDKNVCVWVKKASLLIIIFKTKIQETKLFRLKF
jgi:hypothetical protein